LVSEQDISQAWRELFYNRPITAERLSQGEQLLERLKPESPLRFRFTRELDDFRRLCEQHDREAAKAAAKAAKVSAKATGKPRTVSAPRREAWSGGESRAAKPAAEGARRVAAPRVNQADVLARVAAGELTIDEGARLLEHARPARPLSCRVSEKGALSVYGLQRMPVTLYVEQWDRLLNFADELRDFIRASTAELSRKSEAAPATEQLTLSDQVAPADQLAPLAGLSPAPRV